MTCQLKHIPTPYHIYQGQNTVHIDNENGYTLCEMFLTTKEEDLANAEFIVKACNNHDKLVELVKLLNLDKEWLTRWDVSPKVNTKLRKMHIAINKILKELE